MPLAGRLGKQEWMNTSRLLERSTSHENILRPASSVPPNSHRPTSSLCADLESSDDLRVRNAISRIDPRVLLEQLDAPHRSKWQTILRDWVSVKVTLPLFKEMAWKMR